MTILQLIGIFKITLASLLKDRMSLIIHSVTGDLLIAFKVFRGLRIQFQEISAVMIHEWLFDVMVVCKNDFNFSEFFQKLPAILNSL